MMRARKGEHEGCRGSGWLKAARPVYKDKCNVYVYWRPYISGDPYSRKELVALVRPNNYHIEADTVKGGHEGMTAEEFAALLKEMGWRYVLIKDPYEQKGQG